MGGASSLAGEGAGLAAANWAGWLLMISGGFPRKMVSESTKWNPGFKLVTRISTGLDMKTQPRGIPASSWSLE